MLLHLFARALTLHVFDFHDDDEFNFIDIAMSDSYPSTDMIFKKILRVHTLSLFLI